MHIINKAKIFIFLLTVLTFIQPYYVKASDDQTIPRSESDTIRLARLTSPQKTWTSFCDLSKKYNRIINEEGFTRENEELLNVLKRQISNCYDLQKISPATHIDIAMETTVYLSEIMARFPPIDPDSLPDRVEAFKEIKEGLPDIWYIGELPIAITKTKAGEFEGEFQISGRTVSIAHKSYEHLKSLPYYDGVDNNYIKNYFLTPGPGLPKSWIRKLPDWMQNQYLHNTFWQWLAAFISLPLLFIILYFINKSIRVVNKKSSRITAAILKLLFPIIAIILTMLVCKFLDKHVFATGHLIAIIKFVEYFTILVALIMLIGAITDLLSIIITTRKSNDQIDITLINLALRLCAIALSMVIILEGLQRMGFSLTTVLAGAGVTGLAIALAAQESLRNIFGSVMLLLDKPFVVGQRIIIKGHKGTVESIGLRSTKIRLLSGNLTSIPNDEVAKSDIENIGLRPYIMKCFNVSIPYDTPKEKITEALDILNDIFAMDENDEEKTERNKHVNVDGFTPRISFRDLGSYSLNLGVMIFYHPAKKREFFPYMSIINQEIISRFREAGIKFAFPTQTICFDQRDDISASLWTKQNNSLDNSHIQDEYNEQQ